MFYSMKKEHYVIGLPLKTLSTLKGYTVTPKRNNLYLCIKFFIVVENNHIQINSHSFRHMW